MKYMLSYPELIKILNDSNINENEFSPENISEIYNMKLDVNLDGDNGGIYNGYVYRGKNFSGNEYRFFKEI